MTRKHFDESIWMDARILFSLCCWMFIGIVIERVLAGSVDFGSVFVWARILLWPWALLAILAVPIIQIVGFILVAFITVAILLAIFGERKV